MSQSLAKEFGLQGLHVGRIVADAGFDTPIKKQWDPDVDENKLIYTDDTAQNYWALHIQLKRACSWEIDLRPHLVKHSKILKLIEGKRVG